MPSNARTELQVTLADVDALLKYAKSFGRGVRGAPGAVDGQPRPGRPFTRAATVTLAGALEAFFESLALETAQLLPLGTSQHADIKNAVKQLHGIGPEKVHGLYAMLGVPFILDELSWQNVQRGTVRERGAKLHTARNQIAHGRAPTNAQVAAAEAQRTLVENLAKAPEKVVAAKVKKETGASPAW